MANIIKEFKKLSEEKQRKLVDDKGLLSRNVKKYIKEVVVFYVVEQKQWGVTFSKKQQSLDIISTASDVAILAMNLSSKYVRIATSAAYNTSLAQYEICRRERDELKEQLDTINMQLQHLYEQQKGSRSFSSSGFGGFGGRGGFGGGGASGGMVANLESSLIFIRFKKATN